jgi:glycine cleavage system H protein
MKTEIRSRWREGLGVTAIAVLIVLVLPALAAVLFLLRATLLVALVAAAVAGLVALAVSPRFRQWAGIGEEEPAGYKGLGLAPDVALAPWHTWARIDGGVATVGVDDLAQAAVGPVARVELPEVGRHFESGETLFRAHHGLRTLDARSPLSGTVVAVNDALGLEPTRLNVSPFAEGWAVRLADDRVRTERRQLLGGARAREFFREEVDRLLTLAAAGDGLPTLADGGLAVDELHLHIDEWSWDRVQRSFFTRRGPARAA